MCANRIAAPLTWLGGGERTELVERHERSAYTIAGVVVLLGTALTGLVATLVIAQSTTWPLVGIMPFTLGFAVLIGAVSRAIAGGPVRSRLGPAGRAAVVLAMGVVVGELAAVVMFSGSIDRLLDERAVRSADATPAIAQASADLDRVRQARTALDTAVEQASKQREDALVVARCEYNPSPGCPQTHITGLPGTGPETRTADDFLSDTQRGLDLAVADRDRLAPGLDAQLASDERALAQVREAAMADVHGGLGARWAAMNDHTLATGGALLLRTVTDAFFVLLFGLPFILRLWHGQTSQDRGAAARADVERAEQEANTAIAVKRAEVRAAVETLWAEQQLASERLAVEAQTEIDREQQRRRVVEALEPPVQARSERIFEPAAELPAQPAAELPAAAATPDNLPARTESSDAVQPRREGGGSLIPSIPDVTKAAARWVRPFVPPIIASAIETTTKPLRGTRQVFEETEEIHFSLRRTHKVSVQSEESAPESLPVNSDATAEPRFDATADPRWVESSTMVAEPIDPRVEHPSLESAGRHRLREGDRPAQLPSAE